MLIILPLFQQPGPLQLATSSHILRVPVAQPRAHSQGKPCARWPGVWLIPLRAVPGDRPCDLPPRELGVRPQFQPQGEPSCPRLSFGPPWLPAPAGS